MNIDYERVNINDSFTIKRGDISAQIISLIEKNKLRYFQAEQVLDDVKELLKFEFISENL